MNRKQSAVGALISAVAVVVILLVPLTFGLTVPQGGPIGSAPDSIRSLIADPPRVDCVALATQYGLPTEEGKVVLTYIPNEVDSDNPDARDTSDAVNISAIPAERDRINASICTQPEMAGMVGVALAKHQMVGTEKMAEINPNLFGQFTTTTPKEWADKVLSGEISYAEATMTMTQLAGIMTIAEVTTAERTTAWNYRALEQLSTAGDVRAIVENDQQYTGDFLLYSLTHKGDESCWGVWGINIGLNGDVTKGDQRIAGFSCETPPAPPSGECTEDCGPTVTEEVCPTNPNLPPDSPLCLQPKGDGGVENGWTPLESGPLTDGQGSQHQQDSGETSGNVTDNQVPSGTQSGDVTTELPKDTVVVDGGNAGGDDQSQGEVDHTNTNQDDGGTNGDVCVADPVIGITC